MAARGCLRLVNILRKRGSYTKSDSLNCNCAILQKGNHSLNTAPLPLTRNTHTGDLCSEQESHKYNKNKYQLNTDKFLLIPHRTRLLCSHSSYIATRGLCTRALHDAEDTDDDGQGTFDKFGVSSEIQQNLRAAGIYSLFPVQYETFQHTIQGKDVIVQARTGTGKTLSFALPLVQLLEGSYTGSRGRKPKVIVLAPTRELACQVKADFEKLTDCLSVCAIYGGTAYEPQQQAMRSGVDIIVGTPGRVNDLVEKGNLDLSEIEHVVLDEVDRMLDMGFSDIVEQIIRECYTKDVTPQTLMYSATMPPWVKQTARKYLKDDYQTVNLVGDQKMKTSTTVEQLAIKCHYAERPSLISDIVKVYAGQHGRAIVFCKTKREADELCTGSLSRGSAVLHGDVPQAKREMVIKAFKDGKLKVLLTTDVAARGLDIPNVNVVIQTQPPEDLDSFVHRTGRTGRAGKSGVAICFYQPNEREQLKLCEKSAKIRFRHIQSPTPEEIIKASARDASRSLDGVPEETIDYFRTSAEQMIQERGAVESLAAAMAVITGATKIATRSLLSNKEGYTTYMYKADIEMRGVGLARSIVRKLLGDQVDVRQFTFTEDKTGVVFDVPSDYTEDLEMFVPRQGESLEKLTNLPALQQWSSKGNFREFEGHRGAMQRSFRDRRYNKGPDRYYETKYNKYRGHIRDQSYRHSQGFDDEEEDLFTKFDNYQRHGTTHNRSGQFRGTAHRSRTSSGQRSKYWDTD